ncbi:hypothetical protein [Sediminibacterium ginsengisoli]|uniref:GLPGLI family protein n=1 Tax=Sediminibacterium ginsengisoli TaxID=413434 RepID=A0A1T4RI22_9BACT|nr:hypothetical protein [Sediminibacterium ginsengisoli]SKA15341.1 hypothetical protein SAMN04488132_11277 [Sediminibacterium ginsengisoli]
MNKLILIFLLFFTKQAIHAQVSHEIKAVSVTYLFPLIDNAGKFIRHEVFDVNIYAYKDLRLYEMPFWELGIKGEYERPPLKHEVYYLYKVGDTIGFKSENHEKLFNLCIPIDTFMKQSWFSNENFNQYSLFKDSYMKLISIKKDSITGAVEEIYDAKEKEDTTSTARCYFLYKPMIHSFGITLSRELDSIKQMRLCRVKVMNNPRLYKNLLIETAPLEFRLDEVPVEVPERYIKLFNMYYDLKKRSRQAE